MNTIEEVIAAMRALDSALPANDGVKWFNFLYLKVTETLHADAASWQDWPFLQRLDVVFANLYFDAILSWEQDQTLTPHAWRPLLRARHDATLMRIQFALAGMNAHINRDLAVAMDRIAESEGRFPSRNSDRHSDFSRVNETLERVEASFREELFTGLLGQIDQALGELDNILAMWKVRKAREAAWTNGEVLWNLRTLPLLQREYLAHLDQMTAFAGRGLLLPVLHAKQSGVSSIAGRNE